MTRADAGHFAADFKRSSMKMMKILMPVLLLVVMLTGCDRPKHVSGAEFKREFELRNQQTMFWAEYMGEKDGKVFLWWKRAPLVGKKWKEEVWFTEMENLDPDFLKELKQERAKLEQDAAHVFQTPRAVPENGER
jgi:hypothetical protein